jgi:hypothetical protein
MEEDETGGVDPLDPGQSSSGLGPVQEVPEDLSVKREAVASSSSSVSPPLPHTAAGFKTNVSRSSSSPSSEGELLLSFLLLQPSCREALWFKSCLSTGYRCLFWDCVGKFS